MDRVGEGDFRRRIGVFGGGGEGGDMVVVGGK